MVCIIENIFWLYCTYNVRPAIRDSNRYGARSNELLDTSIRTAFRNKILTCRDKLVFFSQKFYRKQMAAWLVIIRTLRDERRREHYQHDTIIHVSKR